MSGKIGLAEEEKKEKKTLAVFLNYEEQVDWKTKLCAWFFELSFYYIVGTCIYFFGCTVDFTMIPSRVVPNAVVKRVL